MCCVLRFLSILDRLFLFLFLAPFSPRRLPEANWSASYKKVKFHCPSLPFAWIHLFGFLDSRLRFHLVLICLLWADSILPSNPHCQSFRRQRQWNGHRSHLQRAGVFHITADHIVHYRPPCHHQGTTPSFSFNLLSHNTKRDSFIFKFPNSNFV